MARDVEDWLWQLRQIRENLPVLIPYESLRCLFVIGSNDLPDDKFSVITKFPLRGVQGIIGTDYGSIAGLHWKKSGELEYRSDKKCRERNQSFGFYFYDPKEALEFDFDIHFEANETLDDLLKTMPASLRKRLSWAGSASIWQELLAHCCLKRIHPLLTLQLIIPNHVAEWVPETYGTNSRVFRCAHDYRTITRCALSGLEHLASSPAIQMPISKLVRFQQSTGEFSRPMPLTDIADRILKDPKKTRKLKAIYGDRLSKIGDKSWTIRYDGLPDNLRKEVDRP